VRQAKYIGIVCMLLSLTRPFSRNSWTNVNDPRISFNAIIARGDPFMSPGAAASGTDGGHPQHGWGARDQAASLTREQR
jgi:hypothetical protein